VLIRQLDRGSIRLKPAFHPSQLKPPPPASLPAGMAVPCNMSVALLASSVDGQWHASS